MVESSQKKTKRIRATSRRAQRRNSSGATDSEQLGLPQDEIRRLVLSSTIRFGVEPFVRQMVRAMDNLKAGRVQRVATLTVSTGDQSRATLITAISNAAREGNSLAAHETAFLAALYAYENSLDHVRAFMRYLDGLRKSPRTKISSVKLR